MCGDKNRCKKMADRRSIVLFFIFLVMGAMVYGSVYSYNVDTKSLRHQKSLPYKQVTTTRKTDHVRRSDPIMETTTAAAITMAITEPVTTVAITEPNSLVPSSPSVESTDDTPQADPPVVVPHTISVEERLLNELSAINCSLQKQELVMVVKKKENDSFCYNPRHPLKCFQDPINCTDFEVNADRELSWPAFGEYTFLSHYEWVKVLQHGGVVFLYHPCADPVLIDKLRQLTQECLRRFVLTPSLRLTRGKPIALVTWGCYLLMDRLNSSAGKEWIRAHAFRAPASHNHQSGTFKRQLLKAAEVVTDAKDSFLCPEGDEAMLFATPAVKPAVAPHNVYGDGEELILKRLSVVRHDKTIVKQYNVTLTHVDAGDAAWALASLVFLCGLLLGLMLYTKLLKTPSLGYRYQGLNNSDPDTSERTGRRRRGLTGALIKSSQVLINTFRNKRKHKLEAMGSIQLLSPIVEDSEEEI